jgi:hypothetical protein
MSAILLAVALAAAGDKPTMPDVEGKWLIVYMEEGGKRNTTWEQQVATIKGDTLSYSKAGDNQSMKLAFGPDQTVKATPSAGGRDVVVKPMTGVAIVGQDYLCLSLNADGRKPEKGSSGSRIIILRRQR